MLLSETPFTQRVNKNLHRIINKCKKWWSNEFKIESPSIEMPQKKDFKILWQNISDYEKQNKLKFGDLYSKLGYNENLNKYVSLTYLGFDEFKNLKMLLKNLSPLLNKLKDL